MKEAVDQHTRIELEQRGLTIDRLCAAVKMPGIRTADTIFLGWSIDGRPTMVSSEQQLSQQARESFHLTHTVDFPLRREYASVPIVPVEFVSAGKPIDRQDPHVEDILVYGIKDKENAVSLLRIEELDILEAILQGHAVWEDLNTSTVFARETIPTLKMHMTMIPTKTDAGERVIYALMFAPVMKNESNELVYQQFLVQTIKSLISLDQQQKQNQKRGYEQAAASILVNEDTPGSDAYIVMQALKDLGIVNMDEQDLDALRVQSSGKGFGYQLLLLAKQAGLVKIEGKTDTKQQVEQFTVDELMRILQLAYRLARQSVG